MSFFRLAKEGWDSLRATLAHSDPVPIVGQKRSRENDEEIEGEGAAILKRKNDNSASPVLREVSRVLTLLSNVTLKVVDCGAENTVYHQA